MCKQKHDQSHSLSPPEIKRTLTPAAETRP